MRSSRSRSLAKKNAIQSLACRSLSENQMDLILINDPIPIEEYYDDPSPWPTPLFFSTTITFFTGGFYRGLGLPSYLSISNHKDLLFVESSFRGECKNNSVESGLFNGARHIDEALQKCNRVYAIYSVGFQCYKIFSYSTLTRLADWVWRAVAKASSNNSSWLAGRKRSLKAVNGSQSSSFADVDFLHVAAQ